MVEILRGAKQGNAETAALFVLVLLGGFSGYVGPFFAIFSHFGGFLNASYTIFVFWDAFLEFCRFFVDFGWISGGFWDGFSMVFRFFAQNRDFLKIVVFP